MPTSALPPKYEVKVRIKNRKNKAAPPYGITARRRCFVSGSIMFPDPSDLSDH
jgi:hypothetical protein